MWKWLKGSLILTFVALLLAAPMARAALYPRTSTMYLKMAAPAGLQNGDGLVWTHDIGYCNAGADCIGYGQNGQWDAIAKDSGGNVISWTGWAKCKAYANKYKLIVRQEKAAGVTWTWPHTLTCEKTLSGNTFRRTTTLANSVRPASSVPAIANVAFNTGLKVELWSNAYREEKTAFAIGYLPAGSYTDTSVINAVKTGGAAWPGAYCSVDELGSGQVDVVIVHVDDADEAVGKCVINGSDFKVEVDYRT